MPKFLNSTKMAFGAQGISERLRIFYDASRTFYESMREVYINRMANNFGSPHKNEERRTIT